MELINTQVQEYSEKYSTAEDDLLKEIADYTYANHPQSQMLSGHVQGRLLHALSAMMSPKRILEVGTFMGYSALCLAAGLTPGGLLYTLELREDDAAKARSYFNKSLLRDKIILQVGDALKMIPDFKEEWDLVFIDADKVNYINYYELVLPQLRKGGVILADNVLFHGEIFKKPLDGKNAKAIQAFNDHVMADKRVETVLVTVRDGLSLIRKK